jgi:hypothetical protein
VPAESTEAEQTPRLAAATAAAAVNGETAKEAAAVATHCPWQHIPHLCCAGARTVPQPEPAVLHCLSPSSCCSS